MLNKRASWAIWFVLLIQFLYMMNNVMPEMASVIMDTSEQPGCAGIPDLSFGISQEKVYQELDCLGTKGRNVYQKESLQKDSIYPISYGLFFAFTIFSLSSMLFRKERIVLILTAFPLCGTIFDYLENHYLRALVSQFPQLQQKTITLASIANIGKWSFIYLSIAITIALAVWVFIGVIKTIKKG